MSEATLPGLETVEPVLPVTERTPWIERGPQKRLMLFAGRSNPELAERIADTLGVALGEVELKTFANGETYVRYDDSIRGSDAFIVQSGNPPVNDHLVELLIMIQAAKLASAKRITAVVPWYPYSRQDKKSRPREPITARLVADFLESAGVDRVLTMDLHAGQIQGFFNVPVDHMTALPLFANYYRDKGLYGEKIVAVSPDPGRAKMARRFGQMLEADLAIMNKVRPEHDTAEVTEVIGDVEGKVAILSDDMIVTGGTLIAGAHALKEAGATEVYACATHGLFPGNAFEKIAASELGEVTVADTVPVDKLNQPDKIKVISVSKLLAETIYNVFADDSVSAIFAGENQLF
ncbi:MAG TPA: ribose-phosphate pyrophosphokinase [Gaiellaceae bacterium]|jgi:ribose-phosphate pyrophosphokinase|nr:ribose-phosphate pyrophosphokinase [Gaiellaceae bacterium]